MKENRFQERQMGTNKCRADIDLHAISERSVGSEDHMIM